MMHSLKVPEGFDVALRIIPYLVAILVAVGMLVRLERSISLQTACSIDRDGRNAGWYFRWAFYARSLGLVLSL